MRNAESHKAQLREKITYDKSLPGRVRNSGEAKRKTWGLVITLGFLVAGFVATLLVWASAQATQFMVTNW